MIASLSPIRLCVRSVRSSPGRIDQLRSAQTSSQSTARSLIKERQREGIALAKQRGAYRGRKKALSTEQVADLLDRVSAGVPKAAIARSLGISRETLYQYLRSASKGTGDGKQTQTGSGISTAVGEKDPLKVATIRLWMRIENNNKYVRGRKRAREYAERRLAAYGARELPRGDYEPKVPYVTDKELDRRMDDLLREMGAFNLGRRITRPLGGVPTFVSRSGGRARP